MEKKLFTKDELRKIRDVASLLTSVNKSDGNFLITDAAFQLWNVFEKYDGESIYER